MLHSSIPRPSTSPHFQQIWSPTTATDAAAVASPPVYTERVRFRVLNWIVFTPESVLNVKFGTRDRLQRWWNLVLSSIVCFGLMSDDLLSNLKAVRKCWAQFFFSHLFMFSVALPFVICLWLNQWRSKVYCCNKWKINMWINIQRCCVLTKCFYCIYSKI